jgi:hypothetical protein
MDRMNHELMTYTTFENSFVFGVENHLLMLVITYIKLLYDAHICLVTLYGYLTLNEHIISIYIPLYVCMHVCMYIYSVTCIEQFYNINSSSSVSHHSCALASFAHSLGGRSITSVLLLGTLFHSSTFISFTLGQGNSGSSEPSKSLT